MSNSSKTFTVEFIGCDNQSYSNDYEELVTAKREAVSYSENGCHCITIVDENGTEYPFV